MPPLSLSSHGISCLPPRRLTPPRGGEQSPPTPFWVGCSSSGWDSAQGPPSHTLAHGVLLPQSAPLPSQALSPTPGAPRGGDNTRGRGRPQGEERGEGGAKDWPAAAASLGNLQRCQGHRAAVRPSKPCSGNRQNKAPDASSVEEGLNRTFCVCWVGRRQPVFLVRVASEGAGPWCGGRGLSAPRSGPSAETGAQKDCSEAEAPGRMGAQRVTELRRACTEPG